MPLPLLLLLLVVLLEGPSADLLVIEGGGSGYISAAMIKRTINYSYYYSSCRRASERERVSTQANKREEAHQEVGLAQLIEMSQGTRVGTERDDACKVTINHIEAAIRIC